MAKEKKTTEEQPRCKGTENQAGIAGDGAGAARPRGASASRRQRRLALSDHRDNSKAGDGSSHAPHHTQRPKQLVNLLL